MKTTAKKDTILLDLLKIAAPDSSMSTLRSWIAQKRVYVDGKVADRAKLLVLKDQEVSVGHRVQFARGGLRILYEDDQLIVIDKPEGLLSVATDFKQGNSAHDILKRRLHANRVFPVHRLDRETSGVMLFAVSESSRHYFKEEFKAHTIQKTYYALVEGAVELPSGTWESYLEEDERYFVRTTLNPLNGKLATTDYEKVEQNHQYTLLRLNPQTGRKNQLRVHCSEAGYPIAGDKKYGAATDPLKRVCLHSHKLSFVHPTSKKQMTFEVPIPEGFFRNR